MKSRSATRKKRNPKRTNLKLTFLNLSYELKKLPNFVMIVIHSVNTNSWKLMLLPNYEVYRLLADISRNRCSSADLGSWPKLEAGLNLVMRIICYS